MPHAASPRYQILGFMAMPSGHTAYSVHTWPLLIQSVQVQLPRTFSPLAGVETSPCAMSPLRGESANETLPQETGACNEELQAGARRRRVVAVGLRLRQLRMLGKENVEALP